MATWFTEDCSLFTAVDFAVKTIAVLPSFSNGCWLFLQPSNSRVKMVFKSLNKLNARCLHNMLKNNDTHHDVRATKSEQPLRRTTNYGLRTFSYIGPILLNLLVQEYPQVLHMDLGHFKSLLKQWTGPKCDVSEMHLL